MTRRSENDHQVQDSHVQDTHADDTNRPTGQDGTKTPNNPDEIQFFDTTIVKLVKDPKTGDVFEVMSDHLAPGERLKRDVDAEKAKEKADKAAKALKDSQNK